MNRIAAAIAELDAVGAPDAEYRRILSTASKRPLRRDENWRQRAIEIADYVARVQKVG